MQQYTFEKYSQEEIIEGIKNNDSRMIQVFYQSQYKKIEQYILANNGDPEDAKDIYQEAFVVLWRNIKLEKFHPENGTAIAGYLYQIAKNKWLDKLRNAKNKITVELQPNLHEAEEENEPETEAYHQWVVKEFENLGETCKEVLKRFYFQKESMEQIASAFDWTSATARNNKYRCIQQLKEKWKTKTK
ncbi:RNA polymerase sigma factor [Arthrospiribacter ruber]|uniref:Sigma-70 family RNA polymerase sigma factor n=1 Tax=Arthrospiribacter ruber TaxID=2487934 RepID=A0A951IW53_9BACT|nr:sigma-70 family RNA polymerase sigma factor [Arthrospiribacter ruber]MBW3467467.1 sigma-70 family RNA polymerase sigma factor [Arthrospiribacter ruber]